MGGKGNQNYIIYLHIEMVPYKVIFFLAKFQLFIQVHHGIYLESDSSVRQPIAKK